MLSIIKKFNQLFDSKQKRMVFILLIMMLVGAGLEIVGVSLMLPLMTVIMEPEMFETNGVIRWLCEVFSITSHSSFVIACIVTLILVFIIKNLYLMLEYYVQNRFIFRSQFSTQQRMLRTFLDRPYEYFLNARTGEILRVIQYDVTDAYSLLMTLMSFVTETIVSVALIVTIFIVDPMMTGFVALMMLLNILVIAKVIKPILHKMGINVQVHAANSNKWLLQSLHGVKEVKVANKERFFEEQYGKHGWKMIRIHEKSSVLNHFPRLLIEMVSVCSMLTLIAIMIRMGRDMESLMPVIAAFAMAALKLMPSANRIVSAINAVAYKEPALDQLIKQMRWMEEEAAGELTIKKPVTARENRKPLTLRQEIRLKNIRYHYPRSEEQVLDQAEMRIPVGKSVGIVGVSGAGKTTTVDIMLGLLTPQEGQVLVDGVDAMECYEEWVSHIGYIPQSIFLMDDTIRANVAFGVEPEMQSDEQVWHALEEAQLAEFIRSLPAGLDTRIGERGVRLSGGQRQRVGIARALYHDPELLVFDEATSSLDNETEAAIMESINRLHGKKTLVIIAHRLQTIEGCDMVYRVEGGKIIQER